jgi:hypothetical protein
MLLAAAICARPPFFNQPSAGALSEHLDAASRQPVKGRASDTAVRKGIDPSVQSAADAAVRKAMKGPWPSQGRLDTLVDVIHANADSASIEVLDEARALRAKLREEVREAMTPTLSISPASAADAALRKAIEAGTLEGLMDAIHANAEKASPDVLEEARAVRDELRDGKPAKKAEAANSADAALRKAIEAGTLEGLVDAIHANADQALPDVLEEARALRDELRDGKHAAAAVFGPEEKAPPAVSGADKATGSSKLSEWASEHLLSEAFFNAQPKKRLVDVGVTIHCFDDTESLWKGPDQTGAEPWRPCSPGDACPAIDFGKWWSTCASASPNPEPNPNPRSRPHPNPNSNLLCMVDRSSTGRSGTPLGTTALSWRPTKRPSSARTRTTLGP